MEMGGWNEGALLAAATPAGAAAVCERIGRPPEQAEGIRLAAAAELARRAGKRLPQRASAPVVVAKESKLHLMTELMQDPFAIGFLSILVTGLRMLTSPWKLQPRRSATIAVELELEPFDGLDRDAAEWLADEMSEYERRIEQLRNNDLEIGMAREELPYEPPYRHLITDLIEYADDKLQARGRPAEVDRLADSAIGLPRSAIAVLNAGTRDHIAAWRLELVQRRWSQAPRRAMLVRLHREGLEILASHPTVFGEPEPGPPRGIWPPIESPYQPEEKKVKSGQPLAEALKPPS